MLLFSADLCNGDDSGTDSSSSSKNFKRRDNSTTPPRGSKKSPGKASENKHETNKTKSRVTVFTYLYGYRTGCFYL